MLHFTCDQCGKELRHDEDHYVVKIEVFAALVPIERVWIEAVATIPLAEIRSRSYSVAHSPGMSLPRLPVRAADRLRVLGQRVEYRCLR